MSILVNKNSKIVVQGITGSEGDIHTRQMLEYGTNIVAGVTPGKGGQKFEDSVPIYETVKNGFRIILSDKNVKSILINIFGGIVRCDLVAKGVVQAVKELGLNVPVVVRLQGTNAEKAKKLLAESGLSIIPANGMKDAAEKAVKVAIKKG